MYVSNANAPAADHLVVGGYDVTGEVRSDGEPMKEVTFLLYSATVRKEVRKYFTHVKKCSDFINAHILVFFDVIGLGLYHHKLRSLSLLLGCEWL